MVTIGLPILAKSVEPMMGGCLKIGVFSFSKSENSFKNRLTCKIMRKMSSADGL